MCDSPNNVRVMHDLQRNKEDNRMKLSGTVLLKN